MKKIFMAWVFVFLTMMLCGPGQAAIEWDPVLVGSNFMIVSQGGTFVYYPTKQLWNNKVPNIAGQHTLTEEFGTLPGSATLFSQSSGGILPMGSQVQVYADITYTDGVSPNYFGLNTYGMNVSQHVTANIVRKFTNTDSTPMIVDLVAEFTGALNFDSFGYDYTTNTITDEDAYAYYLLSGTVTLMEYAPAQGLAQTYVVTLDNNRWSDTYEDIVIQPNTAEEDYYYYFSTSLTLETYVKNWKIGQTDFEVFELDNWPFLIGSDPDNPFTLTATVPVPPSLVLLISGLGGLALARRRFSKGRQQG